MEKLYRIFGFITITLTVGLDSVIVNKSDSEVDINRAVLPEDKQILHYQRAKQPSLDGLINITSFPPNILGGERKKHRRERIRKRKEKSGKILRHKIKSQKPFDYVDGQILRNHEKINLVRNKTIEILKNGMKILSAEENYMQDGNKSIIRVNETLLEKILSSASSKQDVLSSATGIYKVPVGVGIYETQKSDNLKEKQFSLADSDTSGKTSLHLSPIKSESGFHSQHLKKPKQQEEKSWQEPEDIDYDSLIDFTSNTTNDVRKPYKTYSSNDYESVNVEPNVGIILEHIVTILKNLTNCPDGSCYDNNEHRGKNLDDPCLKWLNCRENLDRAFHGENISLPSCPCIYPSTIFYDDTVWDEKRKRYFRWRDASSEAERLDIYKPGAAYCIRSLLTRGSSSVSSQQCCYDRKLQLLTRGSGAGTINFISPDVSKRLHYTIDVLPWRLCKGDFTRYNLARSPDNGNNCPENPDEQQYQLQVKLSKIF